MLKLCELPNKNQRGIRFSANVIIRPSFIYHLARKFDPSKIDYFHTRSSKCKIPYQLNWKQRSLCYCVVVNSFIMGNKSSLLLREEEIAQIQEETGCKYSLFIYLDLLPTSQQLNSITSAVMQHSLCNE